MESTRIYHGQAEKRKRADNWPENDKQLLQDLVRESVKDIENKNTDTNTNKAKQRAWFEVRESFNSLCSGANRTMEQLKNQWCAMKIAARKKDSLRRKEIKLTGGGSAPQDEGLSSTDISSWLPNEFVIDSNKFDCDADVEFLDEETEKYWGVKHEPEDRGTCIEQEQKCSTTKKKKPTGNQLDAGIKSFTEVEIACRQEMHKIELENAKLMQEKLKMEIKNAKKQDKEILKFFRKQNRNLDMDYAIMQGKFALFMLYSDINNNYNYLFSLETYIYFG